VGGSMVVLLWLLFFCDGLFFFVLADGERRGPRGIRDRTRGAPKKKAPRPRPPRPRPPKTKNLPLLKPWPPS
jgi:hypothetical protein